MTSQFFKQNRKHILRFVVMLVIFAAVLMMYQLPLKAVLYPSALCVLLFAGCLYSDYRKAQKLHAQMEHLKDMTALMLDNLPETEGVFYSDYRELLDNVIAERVQVENDYRRKYNDMMEYYSMWVHQIKTPIASMRLALQNEDSPLSRQLSSDLFRIEQYVEMVLAFLRLDSDSTDYVLKEHDLDGILRPCIKKFSRDFIGRKIRLSYENPEKTIVTDDKWFSFVVEQILSNSLKYTREGGEIRIGMEEGKLFIKDTGIGIAPEDLPRIFENGFTGYNGRTHRQASGIGLYLCKRVCDRLGIAITAASVVEEGTCITLDLNQYHVSKE